MSEEPIAYGWLRRDGQKGIRNHIAVVFTVECAEHVARRIAAPFEDIQLFGFDGCHSNEFVRRVMSSLVVHKKDGDTVTDCIRRSRPKNG